MGSCAPGDGDAIRCEVRREPPRRSIAVSAGRRSSIAPSDPHPFAVLSRSDPGRFPPIRALHGDADGLVPIQPAREAVAHLAGAGVDVTLTEYGGVGHSITPGMRRELYRQLGEAVLVQRRDPRRSVD